MEDNVQSIENNSGKRKSDKILAITFLAFTVAAVIVLTFFTVYVINSGVESILRGGWEGDAGMIAGPFHVIFCFGLAILWAIMIGLSVPFIKSKLKIARIMGIILCVYAICGFISCIVGLFIPNWCYTYANNNL